MPKLLTNMMPVLIPMLVKQVAGISLTHKQALAYWVRDLAEAYASNNPIGFEDVLSSAGLSPEVKAQITSALWSDENQS